MGLLILAAILVAVLGWTLRDALFTGWRRARLRARPFPHAWREHLRRRVPYVRALPADLQTSLPSIEAIEQALADEAVGTDP